MSADQPADVPADLPAGAWPLVGRDRHLAAIAHAARRAAGALLVGPAGSGRSRLAREAARVLARRDTRALAVVATPWTADTPLGAFAARLPEIVLPGADLSRAEPSRAEPSRAEPSRAEPTRAESTGADELAALHHARGLLRGALVVVDDVHLLDPLSARLVHDLARHREAVLVLTAREGATLPAPVLALRVDGLLERVEVGDLDPAQADDLVERALGGPVEGATRHELGRLSGGNPFLLRELLDAGRAEGALRRAGPVWRWHDDVTPPPRLREVVLARTADLTAPQRELAELLALGGPLGLEVVEALPPGAEVTALERAGVVVSRREGHRLEIALARRLDAVVLRALFSPLGERMGHRRLAAALASSLEGRAHRRREDTVRLLMWRVAGGETVAADDLLEAADHVTGDDPVRAEQLLVEALARGGGFGAASRLANVRLLRGRFAGAEEAYAEAARAPASDAEHADLAVTRAMLRAWGLGERDAAARVHDELVDRLDGRPAPDGLAVLRAILLLEEGKYVETDATVDPVLARLAPGSPTLLPALMVAATVRPMIGRFADGIEVARRARDLMVGDGSMLSAGLRLQVRAGGLWTAHVAQGRLDEAARMARGWYEQARETGTAEAAFPRAVYAFMLGVDAARRGRLTTAVGWFHEAAAQAPLAALPCSPQLAAEMTAALAQSGHADGAREWLARVAAGEVRDLVHFRPWVHLGEAWALAATGRVEEGAVRAREVADEAAAAGQLAYEIDALHAAVRCGHGPAVADRLAEVAARVDSPLAALYARHAASRDGDALDEVAAGFAELDMVLLAAEAATAAAAAHREDGRSGAAVASGERARGWLERCEAAATPALQVRVADDLTAREREIAGLAASGMSSRAIAERLVLSVRTVDNALGSAYAKLGVKGRAELRSVFAPRA